VLDCESASESVCVPLPCLCAVCERAGERVFILCLCFTFGRDSSPAESEVLCLPNADKICADSLGR
jgi:hypothetical protein